MQRLRCQPSPPSAFRGTIPTTTFFPLNLPQSRFKSFSMSQSSRHPKCSICGEQNHFRSSCPHQDKVPTPTIRFCTYCGKLRHWAEACWQRQRAEEASSNSRAPPTAHNRSRNSQATNSNQVTNDLTVVPRRPLAQQPSNEDQELARHGFRWPDRSAGPIEYIQYSYGHGTRHLDAHLAVWFDNGQVHAGEPGNFRDFPEDYKATSTDRPTRATVFTNYLRMTGHPNFLHEYKIGDAMAAIPSNRKKMFKDTETTFKVRGRHDLKSLMTEIAKRLGIHDRHNWATDNSYIWSLEEIFS